MSKRQTLKQKKEQKNKQKQQSEDEQDLSDSIEKPQREKNEDGQVYFQIARNKRVTVSKFKGKVMVNFRQYFEKDGKWLPTKKGITFNDSSWLKFKKIIDDIDQQFNQKQE